MFLIALLIPIQIVFGQLPDKQNGPSRAYYEFGQKTLLTQEEAAKVEQQLRDFEKSTSNAIIVVVVDDLQGMAIEEYAYGLGEKWGLGDEKLDNGIVFLIKPFGEGKREVTIQVGRGLEGRIPDVVCKEIIDREFIPNMKLDKPYIAITSALQVLEDLAKKEYNYKDYHKKNEGSMLGGLITVAIIILLVVILIKNQGGGTTLGGGKRNRRGYWGSYWGGYGGWGSFGGGSSGGGSSGGFGGFGGGSFGGGGASGSW